MRGCLQQSSAVHRATAASWRRQDRDSRDRDSRDREQGPHGRWREGPSQPANEDSVPSGPPGA